MGVLVRMVPVAVGSTNRRGDIKSSAHLPYRTINGKITNDIAVVNGQVVHQNGGAVHHQHWETPKQPSGLPALMLDLALLHADRRASRSPVQNDTLSTAPSTGMGVHMNATINRQIPACNSSSCHGHGYCVQQLPRTPHYRCECFAGWSGSDCEIDVDECISQPCHNNGKCRDSRSGFIGFRRVAEGAKSRKVGIRVEFGQFLCSCQPGFLGDLCDVEANDEL